MQYTYMHRTVKKPMRLYHNILWISISHDDLPINIVQFTSVNIKIVQPLMSTKLWCKILSTYNI